MATQAEQDDADNDRVVQRMKWYGTVHFIRGYVMGIASGVILAYFVNGAFWRIMPPTQEPTVESLPSDRVEVSPTPSAVE